MKLTARLEKISSLVDPGKKIADIGTDHAYIPSYLMSKGLVSEAILTDVNKGPLDNAKSEISKLGFEDRCQLRLGNGLEVVKPGEVDQIIIAGMGGILISEILEAGRSTAIAAEKLILQPMQAQEELRQYLDRSGYEIESEHIVREDFRIYEILVVRYRGLDYQTSSYRDFYLGFKEEYHSQINQKDMEKIILDLSYEIPKLIFNNPKDLVEGFIDRKLHEYSSILDKIPNIDNETINKRKKEINFKLSVIKALKKKI